MKPITKLFFLFILNSCIFYSAAAYPDVTKEFTVKAAFMVKLTHFIQWPEATDTNLEKPEFTICINHSHKIKNSLDQWAQTGLIKNKPVSVKYLTHSLANLKSCDMLFITENEKLNFLLNQAKKHNTLTISDTPGNAKRGVLVNFIDANGKLRFEINLDAAQQSGFTINPRLLKLATIVGNEGKK